MITNLKNPLYLISNSIKKDSLRQLKTFLIIVLLAAFSMAAISCEDTTSPEPTGTIIGKVQPVDQWLRRLEDKSGVEVSLKGTDYSDLTNSDGRYELENVKRGIYTIQFSKEGYDTNKIPFFDFVGGGKVFVRDENPYHGSPPLIGEIPEYTVSIDSTFPSEFGHIPIRVQFSTTVPETGAAMVVNFLGTNPEVSADPSNHIYYAFITIPPGYNGFIIRMPAPPADTTFYYRSYPAAGFIIFPDPEAQSSNKAWASLGKASNVKSVTGQAENPAANGAIQNYAGHFIFLNKNGDVIKRIAIPENATPKETGNIYKQARKYLLQWRRKW